MKQTRRIVLVGFLAAFFGCLLPGRSVRSQNGDSVDVLWRVPETQIETVRNELNFDGEITGDRVNH